MLLLHDIGSMVLRLRFAHEYLNRFGRFLATASPGHADAGAYDWLVRRSIRMQADLGVMAYKPAGSFTYIPNYAILLNTLPRIANGTADQYTVQMCIEALVRHAGSLEDRIRRNALHLLNPVQWFLRGLEIPGRMLVALRVVTPAVGEGPVLRLLTLVSLVVTILAMWDPATTFLRSHHLMP